MAQIIPFAHRRTVFGPEDTGAMGHAYDEAVLTLRNDLKTQRVIRELLAKRIIRLAKSGEVDRDRLRSSALSGFARVTKRTLPMSTSDDYHAMADECFKRAKEAQTERDRKDYLELAKTWLESASRLDCNPAFPVPPSRRWR
jgi:hypothetical protein